MTTYKIRYGSMLIACKRLAMSPDRLRLLASVGLNLVAKSPAILAIGVVLPLINKSLGTAAYGEFLSMLALGSASTLLFGGINVVGRRRLGAVVARGDVTAQSVAVSEAILCSLLVGLVTALPTMIVAAVTASSWSLAALSILPVAAASANIFDNLRAAYNEQYITAVFLTISQLIIYGIVIYFGVAQGAVFTSGLVLTLPFVVSSLLTFLMLIRERPILINLKFSPEIPKILRSALLVTLADGAVFAALNTSLYSFGALGATDVAAWYGTLMRAFQTLLAPVLLVLLPVTTFVALKWPHWPLQTRLRAIRTMAMVGLSYGCVVASVIYFGSDHYLSIFHDLPRPTTFDLVAIALFFGAIVAQKAYAQLVYSIAEARLLSLGTFAVVLAASVAAVVGWVTGGPHRALEVLALGMGLPMILLVAIHHLIWRSGTKAGSQT
ncbi:hypothetical protein IC762_12800 [Bradyrhizobium genosp. L]|uniref:hypothetical protein n=1 Tax=Bradyrhizobium genosp. L TaxID=83637 RepID=UPI0018A2ADFE|nr:hypothetical protein [Bradyrhizobium genosp. L]QPF87116.1 hypothetical protein IC762_12800 [Bradyrhizobium genosp. L]